MPEMKTTESDADVLEFLNCVENRQRAADTRQIVEIMQRITECTPKMWGASIIGFDRYTYHRKDGSEHAFMITGVSPRKAALTVYVMPGFDAYQDQLAWLGKFKHSVSCLYITRLTNVDLSVLEEILTDSVKVMRRRYQS